MESLTSLLPMFASAAIGYVIFVLQENHKMKIRLKEKDIEKTEALKKQRKDMLEEVDKMQSEEIRQNIDLHIADIKQYLYDTHREYAVEKGYMPGFLKETLEAKFEYYHSHGGNGHGVFLFEEMMKLPEVEPDKRK